jgi:hypothetical protein
LGLELAADIHSPVHNAKHNDRIIFDDVENDVLPNDETSRAVEEIVPEFADERIGANRRERFIQGGTVDRSLLRPHRFAVKTRMSRMSCRASSA